MVGLAKARPNLRVNPTSPPNNVGGTWRKSCNVNLKKWKGVTVQHWQYNVIVTQTAGVIKYSVSDSCLVSVWRIGNKMWRIQKQYKWTVAMDISVLYILMKTLLRLRYVVVIYGMCARVIVQRAFRTFPSWFRWTSLMSSVQLQYSACVCMLIIVM